MRSVFHNNTADEIAKAYGFDLAQEISMHASDERYQEIIDAELDFEVCRQPWYWLGLRREIAKLISNYPVLFDVDESSAQTVDNLRSLLIELGCIVPDNDMVDKAKELHQIAVEYDAVFALMDHTIFFPILASSLYSEDVHDSDLVRYLNEYVSERLQEVAIDYFHHHQEELYYDESAFDTNHEISSRGDTFNVEFTGRMDKREALQEFMMSPYYLACNREEADAFFRTYL